VTAGANRSKATPPSVSPEMIMAVAIRLFGEKGYPIVGMRDLSEAVGILPGSLYTHIESKERLLLDIVQGGVGNFTEAITPIVDSGASAEVRVREAIRAHMRVLSLTLEQTRVAFHQWHYLTGENREHIIEVRRDYEVLFQRLLDDGIAEGSMRQLPHRRVSTLSIIGTLGSATEWFVPSGSSSPEEIADAIADDVLYGLGRRA
jgi:TetR/AcrR family transcriptional regulator, cholesterol catabolism regulator